MTTSNHTLITALRHTAQQLENGAKYEWGHIGRCNCGHLVQTVTHLSDREILQSAGQALGEWSEHANDYCPHTGHKVDDLLAALQDIGFSRQDVIHLENLSDPRVLTRLGGERPRYLRRNHVADAILYMQTLADILAEELTLTLPLRPDVAVLV